MYTAFYGLREKPFALSPDPRFLYLAGSHREALAHLLYGIEEGEGFISITGEVGTGKTTLCRTLLERLDGDTELAFLFNPSRTALELLQSICAEFGLPAEGLARRALMTQLDAFLVEQKRQGKRVLLIIDEAQTLSQNTLEQVRLLSNLETSREKLIQILLLGQPELDRKLDSRELRQLRQRISVRWKLEPLSAQETGAYVRHRLAVAAGEPKDLFSDAALREIHRRTGGVPRLVNRLCDRSLLAGYAARAAKIGPPLVRSAAREIPDARRARKKKEYETSRLWITRPWLYVAASATLIGIALLAGLQVGRHGVSNAVWFSDPDGPSMAQRESSDPRNTRMARSDPADSGLPAVGANTPPPVSIATALVPNSEWMSEVHPETAIQVTALPPGLLPELLAKRNRQLAMAESHRAVLESFGRRVPAMTPAPRNISALQAGIESRGLMATRFDGGSIDLLRHLDHPVLLPLSPTRFPSTRTDRLTNNDFITRNANSEPRWIAIIGFEEDRARIAGLVPNRVVSIPIDELKDHWLETGIIVWEQFDRLPDLLEFGEEGSGVLWLQRSLAELDFFKGQPTGRFDEDTLDAVARFQRERGLVSDGIVGPLTQIALYGQLGRYPVPRLSGRSFLRERHRLPLPQSSGRPSVAAPPGDPE